MAAPNREALRQAVEGLIHRGVDRFYVGHQGMFDRMVLGCLKELSDRYPSIEYAVILACLTAGDGEDWNHTIFPEGMELVPKKFAISHRNRWMIDHGDYCLCHIDDPWGGAYEFARMAKARGLVVENLGSLRL